MRHALAAAVLAALVPAAFAADYELDTAHSEVTFKVRHLGNKVSGRFTKIGGTFSYDPAGPATWKAEAKIDPASISTDHEKRDAHLKSPDFFDVAKCPELKFKSTKVADVKDNAAKLHGDLTMHCVTKPIVLDLEMGGTSKDPWGGQHAGFSARGKINRKDWGINWNQVLDTGGLFVGDDVEVAIEVDGKLKAAKTDKK
jgi:polyisoprenoid-binding protein YceI